MPANRQLAASFLIRLGTRYKNTESSLNPNQVSDNLPFSKIFSFVDGNATDKLNLQYYENYSLNNEILSRNLDDGSLKNKWNDALDFDSIKLLIVTNNSTGNVLKVNFKNDQWIIGPGGYRIAIEPFQKGIQEIDESSSQLEGLLTLQSGNAVSGSLIILGSENEETSTSGL